MVDFQTNHVRLLEGKYMNNKYVTPELPKFLGMDICWYKRF